MNEEWRSISGFEGFYEASNKVFIRSVDRILQNGVSQYVRRGKVLKPQLTNSGYLQVNLCKDNIRHRFYVHRIIGLTFVPNPLLLPQINHKDENKKNNNADNLEWCTRVYNMNYGSWPEMRMNKALEERNSEKRSKKVYQYSLDGLLVGEYPSLHEVERITGIKQERISKTCRGKNHRRTYNGFIWSFNELSKKDIDKILFYGPKPVIQLTLRGEFIAKYKTAKEAAISVGCNANGIQLCCRGLRKTCLGYLWKYEKDIVNED